MNQELQRLLEQLYCADDRDYFDLELADQIVMAFPQAAEAWVGRGRVHYKLGDFAEAAGDLAAAEVLAPAAPDVLWLQALLVDAVDESPETLARFAALLDDALARYPEHYGMLLARGSAASDAGDEATARRFWERALAVQPGRERPFNLILHSCSEAGSFDAAIALYERLRPQVQSDGLREYNLGTALMQAEHYSRAICFLDRARTLLGEQNAIQHNRALCLVELGRYDDAVLEWNSVLARTPDWDMALAGRARAYDRLGRKDEAREDERRSRLARDGGDVGLKARAREQYELGNDRAAIELLDHLIYYHRRQDVEALYLRGLCRRRQGQWSDAAYDFRQALAAQPEHLPSLLELAEVGVESGNFPEALAFAEQAIALAGAASGSAAVAVSAQRVRAWALVRLERTTEGLAVYQQLLQHGPELADPAGVRLEYAQQLQALGKAEAAQVQFREVLRGDAANAAAAAGLAACYAARQCVVEARHWYEKAEQLHRAQGEVRNAERCRRAAARIGKPRGFLGWIFN